MVMVTLLLEAAIVNWLVNVAHQMQRSGEVMESRAAWKG